MGSIIRDYYFRLIIAALVFVTAQPLMACSSCFSKVTGSMADSINMGIISLYMTVLVLLGGFACFFINLWKRAKKFSRDN